MDPFAEQQHSERQPTFRLALTFSRGLTPEEGQKRLDAMAEHISKVTVGVGRIILPGVTIGESPWPEWFKEPLTAGIPDLKFDDINFIFYADFATKEEAKFYHQWVVGTYFRSQYIMSSNERMAFVAQVSVAVHEYMLGMYSDFHVDNC